MADRRWWRLAPLLNHTDLPEDVCRRLKHWLILVVGLAGSACRRNLASIAANAETENTPVATAGEREPALHESAAREAAIREVAIHEVAIHEVAIHEVIVPAGTELPIVLDAGIGSDTSHVEEPVRAHLSRAVSVHGQPVLDTRVGSEMSGIVGVK